MARKNVSLTDYLVVNRSKRLKNTFVYQIDKIIDWKAIEKTLLKYDKRDSKAQYSSLLLFKMLLLQTWYGLSDYEIEEKVNDSLSFSYFCGLSVEEPSPDHSTLSRFRTAMTEAGVFDKLLEVINKQLEDKQIIVKNGVLVDASIVSSPYKPKGKKQYTVTKDNNTGESQLEKYVCDSVDTQAAYTVKGNKIYYGYKKHYASDNEGLVLAVETTSANVHDSKVLKKLLEKITLPLSIPVKADKAYYSKENISYLRENKLKNHLQHKATRGKKLSYWEKVFNKLISKERFKIERTFGSIKRWFSTGKARYKGLAKMHTQNVLEAICYNLYRSPKILLYGRKK